MVRIYDTSQSTHSIASSSKTSRFKNLLLLSIIHTFKPSIAFTLNADRSHHCIPLLAHSLDSEQDHAPLANLSSQRRPTVSLNRRQALLSTSSVSAITFLAIITNSSPAIADDRCGLDDITLGQGTWTPTSDSDPSDMAKSIAPATFCTYASRFLIQYDKGVGKWWIDIQNSLSLLPKDQKQARSNKIFGCLARSIQLAIDRFLLKEESSHMRQRYEDLADKFVQTYSVGDREAKRHIAILFSMLPECDQPTLALKQLYSKLPSTPGVSRTSFTQKLMSPRLSTSQEILMSDLTALLPPDFRSILIQGRNTYSIYPPIPLYEVGIEGEFGQTAIATVAGPLAAKPLTRERPDFSKTMYGLFGLSGAISCALTHTVVIPLDVVKTRMQTDPDKAKNIFDGAAKIIEKDGFRGLLLGSQATIAAYLWYGMSVYPSYTFFKRILAHALSPEMATIHTNDVALFAGAMSAVIASIGVTPLEACRIRTVAEPDVYQSKGLFGTLAAISNEDTNRGWKTLYAGLPSLLTRQVIFGSIKFLAFERACEAIYHTWPVLQDATWTSLVVSLAAGGISGILSSVTSQPADSVLTFVALNQVQGKSSLGVLEGGRLLIEQEGIGALYRGLGSRCIWAGSIIGGQFLMYDIFRTFFGVNRDDLAQIYEVVIKPVTMQ